MGPSEDRTWMLAYMFSERRAHIDPLDMGPLARMALEATFT